MGPPTSRSAAPLSALHRLRQDPIRGNELHFAGADAITDSNHALAEHVRHSPATG